MEEKVNIVNVDKETFNKLKKVEKKYKKSLNVTKCINCGSHKGTMYKVLLKNNENAYICINCKRIWDKVPITMKKQIEKDGV